MSNLNQNYLEFKTHVENSYFLITFVVHIREYINTYTEVLTMTTNNTISAYNSHKITCYQDYFYNHYKVQILLFTKDA